MGTPGDPVSYAQQMLGRPYVWDKPIDPATVNPPSADCSGLVMWANFQAGLRPTLIHQTALMYAQMEKGGFLVPFAERQRNDFLWYNDGGIIHHVALVIDDSTLIEAPQSGIPIRTRDYSSDSGIMAHVGRLPGATAASGTTASTPDPASRLSRFHYLPPGKTPGVTAAGNAKSWPAWFASKGNTPSGHAFYPKYSLSGASNSDVKMMHDYYSILDTPGGPVWNGAATEKQDALDRTKTGATFRALTKTAGGENDALGTWSEYNTLLHDVGPGGREDSGTTGLPGVKSGIDAYRNIAGFFDTLLSANLWERVGLFAAGGALLVVGVSAALKNQNRRA